MSSIMGRPAKRENLEEWFYDKFLFGMTLKEYIKNLITPLNLIAGLLILAGGYLILMRFIYGLGTVTHSSNEQAWGLLLGWGLFTGVPLSATGFVIGTMVYVFGLKDYHPIVNNAILLGLLGYLFAVIFLMIDLGRPWRIYYPLVISWGPASVMFLVGWHVSLYLTVQLLEFSSSIFKWLDTETMRKWALRATIVLTISGIILSTLHQSALGAMFLLAPGKIHPLWYTSYIPVLFFVSSIAAALTFVIVVTKLTQMFFNNQPTYKRKDGMIITREIDKTLAHNPTSQSYWDNLNRITLGLGKGASLILFTYFVLRWTSIAHENVWNYLNTAYGYWFLFEVMGLVLLPAIILYAGAYKNNVGMVQIGALITIIGIIVNRLNIALITFNWNLPHHTLGEIFYWKEVIIVLSIVTIEILVYRWIVNRMPVLGD